jgi:hypothetical protein
VYNIERFRILADKVLSLSDAGLYNESACFKLDIPCNIVVMCNSGDSGTVADIVTNSIYLIALGSRPSGTTDGTAYYNARITFSDL